MLPPSPRRRPRPPRPGLFLVAVEDGRSQQIEESVLIARAHRMVETGSGLERDVLPAAFLDELGQSRDTRERRAPTAHLRAEPELAEPEDAEPQLAPERQLAVDLRGSVDQHLGVDAGRLDGLDAGVLGG